MYGQYINRGMARDRLMLVVGPALALTSPVIEAFGTVSVPLFRQAPLIVVGGVAVIGIVFGLLAATLMPVTSSRRLRDVAYVLSLVVIVLLTLDVALGGHRILSTVGPERTLRLGALILTATGLFAVVWGIRRHAPLLFFIPAATLFVSTVALNASVLSTGSQIAPVPPPSASSSDHPPFLYILLDEAMGTEGLKVTPAGTALAAEVRGLFERHGFRVHGGAFSRHAESGRSIPNTLNFDFRADGFQEEPSYSHNGKVASVLFEALVEEGYSVVVYGTDLLDFCFERAARCEKMPSFNPFSGYIQNAGIRARALYGLTWTAFAESYLMYRYAGYLSSWYPQDAAAPLVWAPGALQALDAYAFPKWFDRFEEDVLLGQRGRAYFAHILMPHAPYIYDYACRETGRAIVGYSLTEQFRLSGALLEQARNEAYGYYAEQYRCLLTRLATFLLRLDDQPAFRDATIVIHGDHGARISAGMRAESLSSRDIVDNYSALYAIRVPGSAAYYDVRKTSVQRLTAEYFSGQSAASLGPDNLTVTIELTEEDGVVVRPMPDFGSAVDR